jgi:hypothetical protein
MLQLFKFIFIRIFGRSLDEVGLNILVTCFLAVLIVILFGVTPFFHIPLLTILLLDFFLFV